MTHVGLCDMRSQASNDDLVVGLVTVAVSTVALITVVVGRAVLPVVSTVMVSAIKNKLKSRYELCVTSCRVDLYHDSVGRNFCFPFKLWRRLMIPAKCGDLNILTDSTTPMNRLRSCHYSRREISTASVYDLYHFCH
jgi:hypothetical protein